MLVYLIQVAILNKPHLIYLIRCMHTVKPGTASASLVAFIACMQTGINGEMSGENCSNINSSVKALSSCPFFSWSMAYRKDKPGSCNAESYTGSVCRPQLLLWQDCSAGSRQDVLLDLTLMEHSQEERERDVAQFLHFLREIKLAMFIL